MATIHEELPNHPFHWLIEPLFDDPSFIEKRMFGSRGIYLHGRLVLVLSAQGEADWQGILVATEREAHSSLISEFPALTEHPILGKWLYLPEVCDRFESVAMSIVNRVLADDPRIGVVTAPKSRRGKKGCVRKELKKKNIK